MDEQEDWLGVYMSDEGPIHVSPNMTKDQMWYVLKKVWTGYEAQRKHHMETIDRFSRYIDSI